MKFEEIQKCAMELSASDRARLAAELLDSMSPDGSPEMPPLLPNRVQKENRGAGKFNVTIGLIFLAWTACDLMAGFDGWSSYADISFGLLAIAFIVYGTSQIKAAGGL